MTKHRKYEIFVQVCFNDSASVLNDWVLEFAKLETFELCFEKASAARSVKTQSETKYKSKERILFVLEEKKMTPRRFLQLTSEMRLYTPSTEQRSSECSKYVADRRIFR